MDQTKNGIACLVILLACSTSTGFAEPTHYEQLLNDEAEEVTVDPTGANPKQQKLKPRTEKRQQATLKQQEFEAGLHKKLPATFSVYSALNRGEQQKIYKAYKGNADWDFIYNLIISIATQ